MWPAEVFSIGFTLVYVLQNWLNWFHFLFLERGLLVILIDCMIFPSPFVDVTRISMSTVSFLVQRDFGIDNVITSCLRFPGKPNRKRSTVFTLKKFRINQKKAKLTKHFVTKVDWINQRIFSRSSRQKMFFKRGSCLGAFLWIFKDLAEQLF